MHRPPGRRLVIALVCLLTFAASHAQVKLDVWIYDSFAGDDAPIVQVAERFMQDNPDIIVSLIPTQYGSSSYRDKFIVAAQARSGPDVLMTDIAWSPEFAAMGVALPIDDYVGVAAQEFFPGPVQTLTHEGSIYGLPYYTNALAMFYNRTAFEEAGLPVPEEGWTWEDFLTAVDTLSHGQMHGFGLQAGWGGTFEWYPWVWQNGGEFLSEDLSEPAFNSPEALEATKFYLDLVTNRRYVPEAAKTWKGWNELGAAFANGVIAMFEVGDWGLSIVEGMEPDFEWGVVPLPMWKQKASLVGGANWMINANTRNPDAAYRWLEYVTGQAIFETMDGYNRLAARRGAAEEQAIVRDDPRMQAYVASLEFARPRPALPTWTTIDYDCIQPAFLSVILEGAEVESAMAGAEQCAAAILNE
jgi:ABC-type glycerol-3-phosphate transport system substrate-binding protein